MAYQLLYSRQRNDDVSVRFTDVPVESPSIMVDALSFLSKFKRSAGWLYPIVPSAGGDFERGKGQLILFGKTRVIFPDFPPPYFLEFYPRFGVSRYILSIYLGEYEPDDGVNWFNVSGGDWQVGVDPDEGFLRARLGGSGGGVPIMSSSVQQVYVVRDGVWFASPSGVYYYWAPLSAPVTVVSIETFNQAVGSPDAIVVTS